jgi:hypothetical protein
VTTSNDAPQSIDNPFGQAPAWDRPADKVRSDLASQVQAIRNRKELQPAAARSLIAQKYVAAKQKMDAMSAAAPSDHLAQVAAAKRSAFGIDDITAGSSPAEQTAHAMSYRDAQQRASQLGSAAQARALFDTANQSGDEHLVRAIGNRAITDPFLGAQDIAADYLTSHPTQATAYNNLQQLLTKAPDAASLFEYITPRPSEISNLSDNEISNLAGAAPQYQGGH